MKIRKSQFVTSLSEMKPFPGQGLPEIALAGKSNVGKSSLINSLTNRLEAGAHVVRAGQDAAGNFYCINDEMFLVDLPGYGISRAPKRRASASAGRR